MHVDLLVSDFDGTTPGDVAARAQSLGYGGIWMPELWGESAVVALTEMAAQTEEISLGTAIVNVFSRSPAVLAMTAASLERASDGRFILGTGVSTPKAIEDLHGIPFERPVRRAHETIELVKRFTAGEGRVEYDGQLLEVADFPALEADVPIFHGALGPANRRVVGRLCDGWLPHNIPLSELDSTFETVAETAREAGRDPDDITVAPYLPTAASEDHEAARRTLRKHVAYYLGSGEGYRKAAATRYPEEADRIATAWQAGDRGEAAEAVTDEMLADLGIAGTPEEVRERLHSIVDGTVVDRPIVVIPDPASPELREETIEAVAPEQF